MVPTITGTPRRRGPDRHDRQLDRHHADRLHLPVGALRYRRRQLRRHRGRHELRPTRSPTPTPARPCASWSPARTPPAPTPRRARPTAIVAGNPPANTADPSLSGTARDGETLTLDDGDWAGSRPSPRPTSGGAATPRRRLRRHRRRDRPDLYAAGRRRRRHRARRRDRHQRLRRRLVEATAPSDVVPPRRPSSRSPPAVVGTAVDGQTVTADPGVWAGTAPVTYTYQWLRCELDGTACADDRRRHGRRVHAHGEDAGHGIRVEVTATNAAGSATAISPVAAVNAAAPQNTTLPGVTGASVDGQHADRRARDAGRARRRSPSTTSGCAATPTA